jgi:hypothetical protein
METPESRPAHSCKYVVASRLGRWRVQRDDQDAGAFADRDEAVRFACSLARDQAAGAGIVGVVVVQSDVHEMHCFTPLHSAHVAAAPPPRPPTFRVIKGAP